MKKLTNEQLNNVKGGGRGVRPYPTVKNGKAHTDVRPENKP